MGKFGYSAEDLEGITIDGKPVTEPDKVMPTLEQALQGVVIEWENQNGI
jgi:hypothetical protein